MRVVPAEAKRAFLHKFFIDLDTFIKYPTYIVDFAL